jgi:succinyl-diaminopimelate desuccinylase
MDTADLPTAVAEYLQDNRAELFEPAETLVGYDTQNPPGRTAAVDHLRTDFGRQEPTVDLAMTEIIEESAGFYEPEVGAVAVSPETVRPPSPRRL